jgi:glycerol-3-phosphate dehydrogenase
MHPHRTSLKESASAPFDVIIIGGGINGTGIARDAVLRGFRVALFEQADYASGTSSRSSKLIHGGIRYLEQGHLPLVFEASRERQILERIAPHLVRPLPFLFPVYRGAKWGKTLIDLGMWLYDLLALFRNIRPHRMLGREETLRREPDLVSEGLTGSALYYDGQMDDARLCLANVLEARSLGAMASNYARVTGLLKDEKGRITGVRVQDRIGKQVGTILGRLVVNASGPWVDEVCRMESPAAPQKLRRTRGSHVILPSLTRNHALVIRSRKDERVLFVIPWYGMSLVGTTDVDFEGDPGEVRCPREDLDYLIQEAQHFFPKRGITSNDVIATFAGVRPLIYSDEREASWVPRESKIYESESGLISVTGGKFTTYRKIAEQVVDQIQSRLPGIGAGRCTTETRPLWGGDLEGLDAYIKEKTAKLCRSDSPDPAQVEHLITTYGTRHADVLDLGRGKRSLGERLLPALPHLKAEIVYAVREECAVTLADVLRRRTAIALGPYRADEGLLSNVLRLMASELGWTQAEIEKQREDYLREIA